MTTAVFFAVLSAVFFIAFLYFLELLLFFEKETKRFQRESKGENYLSELSEREKKAKSRRKKNFLLYLRCKGHEIRGEADQAEKLLPFVRNDRLLEIKKEK